MVFLGFVLLASGGTRLPDAVAWAQENAGRGSGRRSLGRGTGSGPRRAADDKWSDDHSIPRSKTGPHIYWPKLLVIWLLFVMWVKSGDWINRDSQIFGMGYGTWNPAIFFPFAVVLLVFTFPILISVWPISGWRWACWS